MLRNIRATIKLTFYKLLFVILNIYYAVNQRVFSSSSCCTVLVSPSTCVHNVMLYIKFKLYGGSRVREKFLLGDMVHFGDVRTFQHLYGQDVYTTQRPSYDNERTKKHLLMFIIIIIFFTLEVGFPLVSLFFIPFYIRPCLYESSVRVLTICSFFSVSCFHRKPVLIFVVSSRCIYCAPLSSARQLKYI